MNKSSFPYSEDGIASTTLDNSSITFAGVIAAFAICCPAGISPAPAAAAINFSNPSNELFAPAAVSPCQIHNSVFCATSAAT